MGSKHNVSCCYVLRTSFLVDTDKNPTKRKQIKVEDKLSVCILKIGTHVLCGPLWPLMPLTRSLADLFFYSF